MFGSRFKTWMENYIGRPKKKVQPEAAKGKTKRNGAGGLILESSESLAQSDTGVSSSSQQVLSSSTTDCKEDCSTTTMDSETHCHVIHCQAALSLPSPESAYSTGYSTDGTSPGGTCPPEYYINIRTGKHYFPSPAPTPTSPHPDVAFSQLHSGNQLLTTALVPGDRCEPNGFPPRLDSSSPLPPHRNKSSPKGQCASLKLFLKSPRRDTAKPRQDVGKANVFDGKKKPVSPSKAKKWFLPFHRFAHRRTDSCDDSAARIEVRKDFYLENCVRYLPGQEAVASPRQRNRIKTNPWLSTGPPSFPNAHAFQPSFPPKGALARNRSCSNTPLQSRKGIEPDSSKTRGRDTAQHERLRDHANLLEKALGSSTGANPALDSTGLDSEEDLTLNEMMGTYNESYVYEKETDILSDSDPTDCDDYETDSEADKGGDERDSHDDELVFIDNGGLPETDDSFPPNTGKCTYHDIYVSKNTFSQKSDRRHSRKDFDHRKSLRKGQDSKTRRERRRQPRSLASNCDRGGGNNDAEDDDEDDEDEDENDEVVDRKKNPEGKIKARPEINENVGGLDLRKVLLQRVMARNASRSTDGSPVAGRRRRGESDVREMRAGGGVAPRPDPMLADQEADNKYRQLITEAENMFESMRNSPLVKSRKKIKGVVETDLGASKTEPRAESSRVRSDREATCRRQSAPKDSETALRKSPKKLSLSLPMENLRKAEGLRLDTSKKSSFKAKSSAHSPLDPLGPTFRNFTVFEPTAFGDGKVPTSSSEDFEPSDVLKVKRLSRGGGLGCVPDTSVVPIAFQSVDLGKPLTTYCPQSEPVKRKIYSCSKTYDKLVKHLENKPAIFEENQSDVIGHSRPSPDTTGPVTTRRQRGMASAGHRASAPKENSPRRKPLRLRQDTRSALLLR